MKLELDLQSPYNPDGTPRENLPTGEVLAWDGKEWCNWFLYISASKVKLADDREFGLLNNVLRFAPLPTIIESDDLF